MKIERVDATTIKCYLSMEEMADYDVEYTDFISRSEKAQRLMQDIIKQAHDEVGYKPPKFAFEMQIMMVPEQGIVLTFSEKEPFDVTDDGKVEAFLNHIKDFVGKITEYRDNMAAKATGNGLLPGVPQSDTSKDSKKKDEAPVIEAAFVFPNMSNVMDFADILPANLRVESMLYKMDEEYFIYMKKGAASYDRFSRACVQALEFGWLYRADAGCDELLKEHGECLITEKALKKLRSKN